MRLAVTLAVAALLVRQAFVLSAITRSARFLSKSTTRPSFPGAGRPATFFVVLPVLRETAVIAEAIAWFETLAERHLAHVIVVTTAREQAEETTIVGEPSGTVAMVQELAATGKFTHLHYPDPAGLKGDQVNFAAAYVAEVLLGDVPAEQALVVCYDADSRPPLDSLGRFQDAIATHPGADVFHQSSRFELRAYGRGSGRRWMEKVCDGGALRANRFVLGFEIPRLRNRTAAVGRLKRRVCSYVYAHVTGHGLCVRLSALLKLPLPERSALEDMRYSFHLGSHEALMVPVASLDRAEVPATIAGQVDQSARWFFGPGRARRYLRDPQTQAGLRAYVQAASALGSVAEWLGCAVIPSFTVFAVWYLDGLGRMLALVLAGVYVCQLVFTERCLGNADDPLRRRVARIVLCPVATILFGVGGFIGAARLVRGGTGAGKTVRR